MPWEKGVGSKIYENVGRKGFELEQAQLERMRKILDKDLKMMERLQNDGEITANEKDKLAALQARVLKIYDKLHATKEHREVSGSLEVSIEPETLEKINKAIDEII